MMSHIWEHSVLVSYKVGVKMDPDGIHPTYFKVNPPIPNLTEIYSVVLKMKYADGQTPQAHYEALFKHFKQRMHKNHILNKKLE
jgi:hypothetical protein